MATNGGTESDNPYLQLKEDESLDDLLLGGMRIIQPKAGYRFSMDAVWLSHFVAPDQSGVIVDLGSGNGVIPILLSFLHPRSKIIGVEIQPQMVRRSQRSIELNRLGERIRIIQADIRELEAVIKAGSADCVVSNPPFWKPEEGRINSNPEAALARHELELNLEQLVEQAARLLVPRGRFFMIHRPERLPEILTAMQSRHLQPVRLRSVHTETGQPASLLLLEAQKSGKGPLEISPPLYVRCSGGDWSEEIRAWYNR